MELQGTIKRISDTQTFASGFQKREMVILTEEQYPQPINVEFLQDKAELLNNYSEGDKVKVSINIGGREWTSPQGEVKYFNSISGWRIQYAEGSTPAESSKDSKNFQATPHEAFGHEKSEKTFAEELDDSDDGSLPF